MLTNQVQSLNKRLTALELQDVSAYTVINKINKFYNSLKFGFKLYTLQFKIENSQYPSNALYPSDTLFPNVEMYKTTEEIPNVGIFEEEENILNESSFLNNIFSILYSSINITKITLLMSDNTENEVNFTLNNKQINIYLHSQNYNNSIVGLKLYDANNVLIAFVNYNNDIVIDKAKTIEFLLELNFERLNLLKLYNNLTETYQAIIITAIKEYLNNNLTHMAIFDNNTEVLRKTILKDIFDDTLNCDVFYEVDELNGEGEEMIYTAIKYYLNDSALAFSIFENIIKKNIANLTISAEIDTEVR